MSRSVHLLDHSAMGKVFCVGLRPSAEDSSLGEKASNGDTPPNSEVNVSGNEIMIIKEQLLRADEFPPTRLLGLLFQLKRMDLGLEDLKATMVGKVVNKLKKRAHGGVRYVADWLLDDWNQLVHNLFHTPSKQTNAAIPLQVTSKFAGGKQLLLFLLRKKFKKGFHFSSRRS
ncbi:hypothetical protein O6H91_Y261600 [Diphasiastrum complanatum]|nr:hypothetical protein O6H91_Y261600 [Diphasiastrum complanatum]